MDDVLEHVGQDHPELAIDPASIDEAVVTLKITLTPTGTLPAGAQVGLCVLNANGSVAGSTTAQAPGFVTASDGVSSETVVTLDQLRGAPTRARDTRASADAYYRTIDDADGYASKATLSGWLAQAGFSNAATGWKTMRESLQGSATGAHALYLNNFDLGFGRDMYVRLGACDDGATPATLGAATAGACDVYSVVINYGSLEAAANNLQPIIAVAMEYSRAPASGARRITKFYTYAPTRQGDFKRVLSIDLDGRGEKFMPGSCTVCHGGTPRGLDAVDAARYGNGGDVSSAFLPWDLDSLLYADTDPAFSNAGDPAFSESERALVARFTRAEQEAAFKRLNHLAYLTYGDSRRFALAQDLIEGWYGGEGLPSASFDGSYVPEGWSSAADGNPADSETIYLDVFARNCRSCHVMHVPGPRGSGQFAIGSYAEFAGAVNLSTQLESGRMPLARLTMDRFWLPLTTASDGRSAAQVLSEHFRDDGNDATAEIGRPGPTANIDGLASVDDTLVRGASYRLDGRPSTLFEGGGYAWRLEAPAGSRAHLSFPDSATPTLVGVDEKGPYKLSLSVSGSGGASCAEAIEDGSAATTCEIRERRDTIPVIETIADQDPVVPVPVDAGISTPLAVGLRTDSPGDGARRLRSVTIADNPAGVSAAPCLNALAVCVSVPAGAVVDEPVPVEVVAEDADGDTSAAATSFGVYVPTELTVRACLREVPTRPNDGGEHPAAVIDINDCVVGAGTRGLKFFAADGVEIADGRFQFTPPPGQMTVFVTAAPDSTRRTLSDDAARIDFRAEFADAAAEDADAAGTVEIRFVGNDDEDWTDAAGPGDAVSFERLRAAMSLATTCGNCHGRPDSPIGFLGVDTQDGYARMRCGVDADDPLGTPYVLLQDPPASALQLKPAGELNHSGRNLDLTGDPVLRHQILPGVLQWIEQGAYDTEQGTDLPCP
jgi:mono/diheme cytochrome c family protein